MTWHWDACATLPRLIPAWRALPTTLLYLERKSAPRFEPPSKSRERRQRSMRLVPLAADAQGFPLGANVWSPRGCCSVGVRMTMKARAIDVWQLLQSPVSSVNAFEKPLASLLPIASSTERRGLAMVVTLLTGMPA